LVLDRGQLLAQPQRLLAGLLERVFPAFRVLPQVIEDSMLILELILEASAFPGDPVERLLLLAKGSP
jgi:hypothetical protein